MIGILAAFCVIGILVILDLLGSYVDPNSLQNQQQRYTLRMHDGGYSKIAKEHEDKQKEIKELEEELFCEHQE